MAQKTYRAPCLPVHSLMEPDEAAEHASHNYTPHALQTGIKNQLPIRSDETPTKLYLIVMR